ncbi:type III secretion system rspB [Pseudomonas gessardii]|nr:type III secretion system rspB [Pseudomonas gessardii]
MSRSLRSISRNADKDELAKFPNQLSSSLFLSQIMVKSLGKTTQCIDKICNLQ